MKITIPIICYGGTVHAHYMQGMLGLVNQLSQKGINADQTSDAEVYVQGGIIGQVGYQSYYTSSDTTYYGKSLSGSMTASDNYYSGSFSYQLSFLDKNHTLISNVDKDMELFNGIGEKGLVIIPEHASTQVAFNIEYFLNAAGILDTTSAKQQLSPDAKGE